jgi:DNA-binding SARP family transcriptional activator
MAPFTAQTKTRLLLALDPLREVSYRWLMRAMEAGGNPAQAVAIFAVCRRQLWERAGMTPSPETERVFREIAGRERCAEVDSIWTRKRAGVGAPARVFASTYKSERV